MFEQQHQFNEDGDIGGKEQSNFLNKTSKEIISKINIIKSGKDINDEAKIILKKILTDREDHYYDEAKRKNPNIKREKPFLYSLEINNTKIYGSIVSISDAPTEINPAGSIAEKLKFNNQSDINTTIAISGSHAQKKIYPFPSDIDLAEHIEIKAETKEEFSEKLARLIQNNTKEEASTTDQNNDLLKIDFLYMYLGKASTEIDTKRRNTQWRLKNIRKGYIKKVYPNKKEEIVDLIDSCKDPKELKLHYFGYKDGKPLDIVKICRVKGKTSDNNYIENNQGGIDIYKEIYLNQQPPQYLIDECTDPNKFINFITYNAKQIRLYLTEPKINILKAMKKSYDIAKALGDTKLAENISGLFAQDSANIHQLLRDLKTTDIAILRKKQDNQYKEKILEKTWEIIKKHKEYWPVVYINKLKSTNPNDEDIINLGKIIINEEAKKYIKDNNILPKLQYILNQVTA